VRRAPDRTSTHDMVGYTVQMDQSDMIAEMVLVMDLFATHIGLTVADVPQAAIRELAGAGVMRVKMALYTTERGR